MSSTLDIDQIRSYLIEMGCKIEYPILVNAFKSYLYNDDPSLQAKIRTQFKDYVNCLATVSLENNMKFINLRPEFIPAQKRRDHQQAIQPPPLAQSSNENDENSQPHHPRHQRPQAQSKPRRKVESSPSQQQQQLQQQQQGQRQRQQYQLHQQDLQQHPTQQHQRQQPLLQQQFQQLQQPHEAQPSQHQLLSQSQLINKTEHPKREHQHEWKPIQPPTREQESMNHQSLQQQQPQQQQILNQQIPPPRPPPRRRQSTASLFKPPNEAKVIPEVNKNEFHEFSGAHDETGAIRRNLIGPVSDQALRLSGNNTSQSSLSLSAPQNNHLHSNFHSQQQLFMPRRNDSMKESSSRPFRDSNAFLNGSSTGGLSVVKLQRNGSYLTTRSRSSHRGEDESDSSSLQPTIDPLRRKWAIEACSCNYNGLLTLLREDPKLASYKDFVNGYTALHWAAKFGNLDIIKLIAGTHGVSANIKSSAGQTPLHVAYMFNRLEAARLLLEIYRANPDVRDHSGKRPMQYYLGEERPKKVFSYTIVNNHNKCLSIA